MRKKNNHVSMRASTNAPAWTQRDLRAYEHRGLIKRAMTVEEIDRRVDEAKRKELREKGERRERFLKERKEDE